MMQNKNTPKSPYDLLMKVDRSPLLSTTSLTTAALSLQATMLLAPPCQVEEGRDSLTTPEEG